jgi:hypothetical protein
MTANKTSRWCWNWETTPGTTLITVAGSTSYFFGEYDEQRRMGTPPTFENVILSSYKYDRRTPYLTDGKRKFPPFSHAYYPTTAQAIVRMLGKCTDASPDTFEPLDSGVQYPITVRFEENEGTTPSLVQFGECYTIGLMVDAAMGSNLLFEETFIPSKVSDQGDYASLTTTPTQAGGANVDGSYDGVPTVTWNAVPFEECIRARILIEAEYSTTFSSDGLSQTVYKHRFKPIQFMLNAIFEENSEWDDFYDRNARAVNVKVYKPDLADYIQFDLANARAATIKKTGVAGFGYYEAEISGIIEDLTGSFTFDGSGTWGDHFKGEVT